MLFRLISTLLLPQIASAFFFGGGGGGCGCQPAPACAPPAPAPCSGGNIVQGYVGAPQQAYVAAPQYPQQGGYAGAPQGFVPPPPSYQPQGVYQAGPASVIAPSGGYQAPVPPAPEAPQIAPAQVQAAGNYQDAPAQVAQVAQVAPAQESAAAPPSDAAYTGEQEVVASLAREEPSYQSTGTGTNVAAAVQPPTELGKQAAAAAAKVAEVIEEDDEPAKKKDEGKTSLVKTAKTPAAPSATSAAVASTTSSEFPTGEEIVPDNNEKEIDISELHLTDDPLCNSDDLRKVVIDNIDNQLNSSKRMIQLAAEAQFGGRFDVICANGDFSYVTNTELYCQETKGDISCYTYRQL